MSKPKGKEKPFQIIAIIDKSGSMETLAPEVISGYNNFLAEQKAIPHPAVVRRTLFDTHVSTTNMTLKAAAPLTPTDYQPGGMTALFDALGQTLHALPREQMKGVVVVITDGAENSSREYRLDTVKAEIDAAKALGLEFVFLGSDASTWGQAKNLGINTAAMYANTRAGTQSVYNTMTANVSAMRSTGASASSLSWDSTSQKKH